VTAEGGGTVGAGGADGVVLRPMRWWDVDAAHRIETDLFPDPWSVETFWSELAHVPETRHYLVAEAGGAVVGYAGLVVTGREADVQTLAVARDRQGGGLGGVLLRALLDEARRRAAGEVLLEVRAENTAAQALYARHGFERIGVRRGYYQPGRTDAYVLRLRLGSRPDGAAPDGAAQ
jgi:[ribosomal protein S18]-alanine N-acetyltransferase